jgi:hypothetical protein
MLVALVGFCRNNGALARMALASRERILTQRARDPAPELSAAIRHVMGARECSEVWVDLALSVLGRAARDARSWESAPVGVPSSRAGVTSPPVREVLARLDPQLGFAMHVVVSRARVDSKRSAARRSPRDDSALE